MDRRRKVMLGAALLWKVKKLASLTGLPIGLQLVFLCPTAMNPSLKIVAGTGNILGDDPPRSGLVTMSWNKDVDSHLLQRAQKMKESYSEAVRALVVCGVEVEEIRVEELGDLYGQSS